MPAGMAAVEAAKANGAWDDLASRMVDVTPDDLEQALAGRVATSPAVATPLAFAQPPDLGHQLR
jgi:uncharacterized protein YdeI (YjbR/CyaY-like superfamily)